MGQRGRRPGDTLPLRPSLRAHYSASVTGDTEVRHRRAPRLSAFDYRTPNAYFVTICTLLRQPLFGSAVDGRIELNGLGEVVENTWLEIPRHFPQCEIDEFVVMPDHFHGVLAIVRDVFEPPPARHASRLRAQDGVEAGSLSAIVGAFKSAVTRRVNAMRGTRGGLVWQEGFYDRIVRSDRELDAIRLCISRTTRGSGQKGPKTTPRTSNRKRKIRSGEACLASTNRN